MNVQATMAVLLQNGHISFLFLPLKWYFCHLIFSEMTELCMSLWELIICCSAISGWERFALRKFRGTIYNAGPVSNNQNFFKKFIKTVSRTASATAIMSVSPQVFIHFLTDLMHHMLGCEKKQLAHCYTEISCRPNHCFQSHLHKQIIAFSLVGWHFQQRNRRRNLERSSRWMKKPKRQLAHICLKEHPLQECNSRVEEEAVTPSSVWHSS